MQLDTRNFVLLCFLVQIVPAVRALNNTATGRAGELVLAQIVFRHGARVPNHPFFPGMEPFWAQYGTPGQCTSKAVIELRNLGRFFREKYIVEEPLLPERGQEELLYHLQDALYMQSTTINFGRSLLSGESFARGIYPDCDPVPIHSVAADQEALINPHARCASLVAELPRIDGDLDIELSRDYPEVLANITALTDWDLPPHQLIKQVMDCIDYERSHGYYGQHPYFIQNYELLYELSTIVRYAEWGNPFPDDDRNHMLGPLVREMVSNMEAQIDGSSARRAYVYSGHGSTIYGVHSALDLGPTRAEVGDTLAFELRRQENGEYTVNALDISRVDETGTEYQFQPMPLNCPTQQLVCPFQDFADYVADRNPSGPGQECCYRAPGFYSFGCDDYLNPDVLNIPACVLYRRYCPEVACGEGQVLDQTTLLCHEVINQSNLQKQENLIKQQSELIEKLQATIKSLQLQRK